MTKALVTRHHFAILIITGLTLLLTGCGSLLPYSTQQVKTPWATYSDAQALYDKIIPTKTSLADLKNLGFDPIQTTTVAVLNHADLLRRLVGTGSFDIGLLDEGLRACLATKSTCFAYEIEQTYTDKKRIGNFWLDFLNFDKQNDITGWQFDAIIVLNEGVVIYKQWTGKPNIHQSERERNPLGPLQGWGPTLLQPR
jgi:hypothetical protein